MNSRGKRGEMLHSLSLFENAQFDVVSFLIASLKSEIQPRKWRRSWERPAEALLATRG